MCVCVCVCERERERERETSEAVHAGELPCIRYSPRQSEYADFHAHNLDRTFGLFDIFPETVGTAWSLPCAVCLSVGVNVCCSPA